MAEDCARALADALFKDPDVLGRLSARWLSATFEDPAMAAMPVPAITALIRNLACAPVRVQLISGALTIFDTKGGVRLELPYQLLPGAACKALTVLLDPAVGAFETSTGDDAQRPAGLFVQVRQKAVSSTFRFNHVFGSTEHRQLAVCALLESLLAVPAVHGGHGFVRLQNMVYAACVPLMAEIPWLGGVAAYWASPERWYDVACGVLGKCIPVVENTETCV